MSLQCKCGRDFKSRPVWSDRTFRFMVCVSSLTPGCLRGSVPFIESTPNCKINENYLKRGEKIAKRSMGLQLNGSDSHVASRRPRHQTLSSCCVWTVALETQQWSLDQTVVLDSFLGQEDIFWNQVNPCQKYEAVGKRRRARDGQWHNWLPWKWKELSHFVVELVTGQSLANKMFQFLTHVLLEPQQYDLGEETQISNIMTRQSMLKKSFQSQKKIVKIILEGSSWETNSRVIKMRRNESKDIQHYRSTVFLNVWKEMRIERNNPKKQNVEKIER